ncbi:hypothetical protein AYI69_g10034, partial [Smittium culicis]
MSLKPFTDIKKIPNARELGSTLAENSGAS